MTFIKEPREQNCPSPVKGLAGKIIVPRDIAEILTKYSDV
jgi:hypothetical protein